MKRFPKLTARMMRQLRREHAKTWGPIIAPFLRAVEASQRITAKGLMTVVRSHDCARHCYNPDGYGRCAVCGALPDAPPDAGPSEE